MNRSRIGLLAVLLLANPFGCGRNAEPKPILKNTGEGPGVTVLPDLPMPDPAAGQTIYVPIYSYIHINDNAKPFNLAATLYIRNTDAAKPIVVKSIRYFSASGALIRSFLKTPIRLDPLASTSFFVAQSDASGGPSPSFLIDWTAVEKANPPVVEAVMVGILMNQAVTLTTQGRVIASPSAR